MANLAAEYVGGTKSFSVKQLCTLNSAINRFIAQCEPGNSYPVEKLSNEMLRNMILLRCYATRKFKKHFKVSNALLQ